MEEIKKEQQEKSQFVLEKNKKMEKIFENLLFRVSGDNLMKLQDEIVSRVKYLRDKYPNYPKYRVYHIISGSTPSPDLEVLEDDFPGEDSIEVFLNHLNQKYGLDSTKE